MTGMPASGSVVDLVKAASAEAGARRSGAGGFSLTTAGSAERVAAPLVGILLGYTVGRLAEVFPALMVPKLPMILLALFIVLLAVAIPPDGWRRIWSVSRPIQCVAGLLVLAFMTAPLGIWMSGSLTFIQERYLTAVVVFLACLVFLRDRRTMRTAMSMYVLCVFAIAAYTLKSYNPDVLLLDDNGEPLDPEMVSIERLRITVGISLDSNDWGAVLATTIPIALWLSAGSFLRRVIWGGAALTMAAAVVPTASRGSLLGLVAVALVLITVGATGWKRLFLLTMTGAAGMVFAAIATEGQLTRFMDFGGDDYNLTNEGRIYFWRQGLVWMLKRPWGYGIDNYPVYFGWLNGPDRAAHSSWVQYGMELGVLGLALFVTLCVAVVSHNRRNRRTALALKPWLGRQAEDEAVLAGHMLAVLAGTLVTGSFLSNAYYPLMYMALGLAGAAALGFPHHDAVSRLGLPTTATPAEAPPSRRGGRSRRSA